MNLIIEVASSVGCSSVAWAFCWMMVNRRQSKSFDHAVDTIKAASPDEQAKVAKAMAEFTRAFGRERPPIGIPLRRGKDPG